MVIMDSWLISSKETGKAVFQTSNEHIMKLFPTNHYNILKVHDTSGWTVWNMYKWL